jgi:hypothetical protein
MKTLSCLKSLNKITLVLAFFISLSGFAQLSGSYTINGALATGGTNYQSFGDAVTALTTSGVNGAVLFNVQTGTYTEQVSIPAVSGVSAINTITIKGLGTQTLLTAAPTSTNRPVLSLNSASHISIEDLKIVVTGTTGWGIHFMNHADSNSVSGCTIEGPATSGVYGIVGSGSISAVSVVQNNAEYLTISDNTFIGCDRSIQFVGMTGPITTPSKQVNYGTDISISNNDFTNFRGKGITVNHYHNVTVEGNTMSTSSSVCNGAASFWDAGDNMVFVKNDVYVSSTATNTRVVVLAMAPPNGPAGDSTKPGLVANNFIQYEGTNSTAPTGLLVKNKAYIKIYNNSFKTKNQGAAANCIWLDNNNARSLEGIEIRNNVMTLENSGSGQFIYSGSNAIGGRFKNIVIDHNDYHAPSNYFRLIVPDGTSRSIYTTFASYQANTKGFGAGALNVDPEFVSSTDLHATSAAMNDSAVVIAGITMDIDGDARSATMPDIGADEYTPPTCPAPTSLGTLNVLATIADVYWSQSNIGSSVELEYGVAGFTLGTGLSLMPTNDTVTLTGLTAQTNYDVYVRELCSASDSSTWTSVTFTTSCGVISTYPYIENFDSTNWVGGSGSANTGSVIDNCWSRTPTSGFFWGTRAGSTTSGNTGPIAGFGGSGKYMFTESSSGSNGSTALFTSPSYDLSSLTVPLLTFQYHMFGAAMGTMSLWAWNGTSYDTVWTKTGAQGATWKEEVVDLSSYNMSITHLVFHGSRGTSFTSDMALDNIQIEEAPACPKITSVALTNPTANSVTSNFLTGGTRILIEYGPTGFAQGTGLRDTAYATGHFTTGLASETDYDFYFQNDCVDSANGYSVWVGPFTIKTLCAEIGGTYFNDWDQLANNATDFCWSFQYYGGGVPYARAYAPTSTYALQPLSGSNIYRWYNSSNNESYLSSPAFTYLDSNNRQVKFWSGATYSGTKTPRLVVGTMQSASDTASFTPVDTILPAQNTWNQNIVILNNVPAGHKHVVLQNATTGTFVYIGIEDFTVEYIPACIAPTMGSVSNITPSSAVISWTDTSANSFNIEYGLSGFTQGTGNTLTTTMTTDTLTGLMAQTCYDVYVQSNCGNNNSQWTGPITFCTPCNIVQAPWTEDFDAAPWIAGTGTYSNGDAISPCWSRNPSANTTHKWCVRNGSTTSSSTGPALDVSGTGNYIYTEASVGTNGHDAIIETPIIDFSALVAPTLSFSYHMYGATTGSIFVTVWDSIQYDTLWSLSGQQQTSSADPFTKVYIDLTAYKNTAKSIRIIGKRGTSFSGDLAIDEISLTEMPTCIIPNAFTIDSVGSTTADFSWNSISNGTAFKMEYGPVGFVQGTGVGTAVYNSGSPTTVTNLNVNTSYDIYIADMCDSTNWVGPITFTTLINYDAVMKTLVSPAALDCGDSTYNVEVIVENNGLLDLTSIPVTVDVTNSVNATVSSTYTTTIPAGGSASISVGNINSYNGGVVDVKAYTAMMTDEDLSNDTLVVNGVELISALPKYLPTDTLCTLDSGLFVAVPQAGITYSWYNTLTDTVPIAMGDTLKGAAGQTVYLDRTKAESYQINNQTSGSLYGSMMKLYIKNDVNFNGFSFKTKTAGIAEGIAFWKMGTFNGSETNQAAWTQIDNFNYPSSPAGTVHTLTFTNPVLFSAGDTVSIYLANTKGTKIMNQGLTGFQIRDVVHSAVDFDLYGATGGAYWGANQVKPTSATATGNYVELFWGSSDVCGNQRVEVVMYENTDTAIASFTHVLNPNGADVLFDGSASSGHTFDWNFGDGTSASGMTTSHTYANGTFTATLVVTDTVCGTIDSVEVIINANVSLSESLLGRTLNVYPNPNNGQFRLAFEMEGIKDVSISIYDELGRLLLHNELGKVSGTYTENVDLSDQASGFYTLLINVNGESVYKKISVLR